MLNVWASCSQHTQIKPQKGRLDTTLGLIVYEIVGNGTLCRSSNLERNVDILCSSARYFLVQNVRVLLALATTLLIIKSVDIESEFATNMPRHTKILLKMQRTSHSWL